MKDLEQQKELIKQFLLGELKEEQRQEVEERLLVDSEYRDEILMTEGELVEDYLAEKLPPIDRENFEKHYLSAPRQQRNVKLTKVLLKAAQAAKPQPPPKANWLQTLSNIFWPPGQNRRIAIVSLAMIAIVATVVIYNAWQSASQRAALQAELVRLNTPENILPANNNVPAVTLLPFSLRENGALPRLTILPTAEVVQLRVTTTANTYQSYNLEVSPIQGEQLVQFDVQPQTTGNTLILQLPARILKQDDYVVTLRGVKADGVIEDVGEYAFRVVRQ